MFSVVVFCGVCCYGEEVVVFGYGGDLFCSVFAESVFLDENGCDLESV